MSAPPTNRRPGIRQTLRRHPLGAQVWIGVGILAFYLAVALSALVEFRGTLATLQGNPAWVPPWIWIGPSWAHPFGILYGFGVSLSTAVWQATPWDLGIVVAILALDGAIGALLGAVAGLYEGRWPDTAITFVSDSFGAIPSMFLVVVVFAGFSLAAPSSDSLPVFIVLFALVLWPTCARAVRDRVRIVSRQPYVEASRAMGASRARILLRHLLPNAVEPVLAQLPIDFIAIFFVLSVFPWWLCVSTNPPFYIPRLPAFSPLPSAMFPEWGLLLGYGSCFAFLYPAGPVFWWMVLFPLLAIVGLGIGLALTLDGIGDWLRART